MRKRTGRLTAVLSFSVAAIFLTGVGAVPATAASTPTFPTWADVLAAEKNAAAKKVEIAKITAILDSLQSQSAASGKTALQAGEAYDEAVNALQTATATATKLNAQAAAAKKKATKAAREAGELAAQLAREGYGNVGLDLFLNGKKAGNLLDVLGTVNNLGRTSEHIFTVAEQEHRSAVALGAQASAAEADKSKKAAAAKAAYSSAMGSANAAEAKVNSQTSEQKLLTAQLASLNGTTASIEAQYLAGVAWEAKQAAQKTPPADPPPPATEPGTPNSTLVNIAIAFARAQLGKPYVLDGYGPNDWDCSGLTKASWSAAGVYIGIHGSDAQYNYMKSENRLVPIEDRQPGDLLFYSDGGSTSASKYHVTLYIGNGEMIEAPYPGVDVRIAAVRYGDLVPYVGRPTG